MTIKNQNKAKKSLLPRTIAAAFIAPLLFSACSGDNQISNAPTPAEPDNHQQDSSNEVGGLIAYYDFEYSLADASGNVNDAVPIGINIEDTENGTADFNGDEGSHPLSVAAEFLGISGLMLPNLIYSPSYSVSMWVKPEEGNSGPFFYAKSEKGWLLLDRQGLTVGGETGLGPNLNSQITYTGSNYLVNAGEYSHVLFTVDHGEVDIYVNGIQAFKAGDYEGQDVFGGGETPNDISDDWILDSDTFNDLFTGQDTVVSLGVSAATGAGEDDPKPFKGKIDNVRFFDEALYHVNAIVLANEVVDEGPGATISPVVTEDDVAVSWSFQRIDVANVGISRESFQSGEIVNLTPDGLLDGDVASFSDSDLPVDANYRYWLTAVTAVGQVFQPVSAYVRVPGVEPYTYITALLNETTEDIELNFGGDNLEGLVAYNILRSTFDDFNTAEVIAKVEDPATATYTDLASGLDAGTPYYYWLEALGAEEAVLATSLTLPEASAKAAGVFSPLYSITIQESEDGSVDGFCSVNASGAPEGAVVETVNGDFTGEGYLNTVNADDQSIVWKVDIQVAGTYTLAWRFANGGGTARNGALSVDGVHVSGEVGLGSTGGWSTWEESTPKGVFFEVGEHYLTLTGVTSAGLSNIDYLTITAPAEVNDQTGPIPVSCTGEQ